MKANVIFVGILMVLGGILHAATLPVTSGLVMHLDADAITDTATGAAIGTWSDLSGLGNHAVQADTTKQPVFIARSPIFGKAVIRFDGVNDFLDLNENMVNVGSFTLFAVGQFDRTGMSANSFMIDGQVGSDNGRLRIGWDIVGTRFTMRAGNSVNLPAWNPAANTNPHIFAMTSQVSGYMDGALLGSSANTATVTPTGLNLGSFNLGLNQFFKGDIAEVIMYNRVLTTEEISTMNAWLNFAAFMPNTPVPANNATNVGTSDESNVSVTLEWNAAAYPGQVVRENIVDQYVFMTNGSADPNIYYVGATGSDPGTTDPGSSYGPLALAFNTAYQWAIVEALEGTEQSFTAGVSTLSQVDPNNITGNIWSFTTIPPDPIITTEPVSQTVASGTVIDLSVTALNTTTYTWYQSADAVADAGDTNIGSGPAIQVTVDNLSKEGWYYCVASSVIGSDTSAMARVMIRRLVGHWDFEGDLADNITDGPTHDGSASEPNFAEGVPALGGQGYKFYGDGRIVTIADSVDYFNFYPQGMTISCWVKNQNPAIWDTVCSKEYEREIGLGSAKGFYLGRSNAGAGAFAIRTPEVLSANDLVTVADWHQLIGVHDPVDGVLRMYVDGVYRNQTVANPANFIAGTNLAPLIFGAESTDATIGRSSATIDDVKIWNYALDTTQIAQQYVDIMGGYVCVGGNPTADLSGDCQVTLADLMILAQNWLESNRIE